MRRVREGEGGVLLGSEPDDRDLYPGHTKPLQLKKCRLCSRRGAPMSRHHLVPVSEGGKHGKKVGLCVDCHTGLHQLFTNAELVTLSDVGALYQHPRVAAMAKHIRHSPVTKRVRWKRSRQQA